MRTEHTAGVGEYACVCLCGLLAWVQAHVHSLLCFSVCVICAAPLLIPGSITGATLSWLLHSGLDLSHDIMSVPATRIYISGFIREHSWVMHKNTHKNTQLVPKYHRGDLFTIYFDFLFTVGSTTAFATLHQQSLSCWFQYTHILLFLCCSVFKGTLTVIL